jgi:glycosyltransferase involved in cell wall biosynthesis
MRVAVEIRNINLGVSGGIAPLVRGVVGQAMRSNPEVSFVVFATMFNSELFGTLPDNVELRILPLHSYWQDIATAMRLDAFDVMFRGYPGPEISGYAAKRQVVLVPDMQHELFPEFFSAHDLGMRRRLFRAVLKSARAIGTISEFAKGTILADPSNRCDDIFLMPPASQLDGAASDDEVSPDFKSRVQSLEPFFFYPANLWKHKNHERFLAAFGRFRGNSAMGVSLVLSGHPEGWQVTHGNEANPGVHHFGFVSSAELRYLYRHALALTFPSLYEGFGMPLLEAFESDCPVACSHSTSLPEVAGGAALLFDPTSIASMEEALNRIAGDDGLRRSLVERGRTRTRVYSWEDSASALIAACKRVGAAAIPESSAWRPLVSIVTPSYNQGRFLRRTIDSVLTQDYPNVQLIVNDGGSTDESVAILQSYGDRITWVSEKDRGQTHAINKGLARSNGEIFAYLNSDDTLAPGAIRRVVEFFSDNPACDMLYGDANYIDEADVVTGKYNTAPYSFERLMFDCCVCQPATFWRASIAKAIGPFDEGLDFVMDYDYWLRIDRAGGEIRYLPETLASSRLYPETKTMSRRGDIYREIFDVCRRHGGYVDRNYYIGYWNYRVNEGPGVLGRALRLVPDGAALAAKLHFAWDNRSGTGWQFVTHELPKKFGWAVRQTTAAVPALKGVVAPPRVEGFFTDGWLAPNVEIRKPHDKGASGLYVSGRPAVPCTVDVVVDGVAIHSQQLAADSIARIEVRTEVRNAVSLRFSGHAVDAAHRPLAFLVFGTNLFSEADLAA